MHRLVIDFFAFQLLVYAPNSSLEWLSANTKEGGVVYGMAPWDCCYSFCTRRSS